MKTNISNVSRKLTLGRGATLASTDSSVIDILQNNITSDQYAEVRSKSFVGNGLRSSTFSSGGRWNVFSSKVSLSDKLDFVIPNEISFLVQNGNLSEAASSRTIDLSIVEISDLLMFQIKDSITGTTNIPFSVDNISSLVTVLNYAFLKDTYNYPYIVTFDEVENTLTISNKNEAETIFTVGLGSYDSTSELVYRETTDLEDENLPNFLTFDGRFSLYNEDITVGTLPQTDTLINRYEFRDSEKCIGYISEEYTTAGELVTTVITQNPNNNGSCFIKLHVDNEGNSWTETLTPNTGDNSNKIATTKYVQEALVGGVVYKGTFDASAGDYSALSDSKVGYMYYVNRDGTIDGIEWKVGDYLLVNANGATDVTKIDNTESEDVVKLNATQTLTNKSLTSPALTGIPTAPTAPTGTRTTQIASTAFVYNAIASQQSTVDSIPTEDSTNLVTSGGVYTALSAKADSSAVPTIIDGVRNTWGYLTLADLPIASKSQAGIVIAGDGIDITDTGLISVDFTGVVKPTDKATNSSLGLVKPDGTSITIDNNGTISANISGSRYVDFTSDETISGTKTFSGGLKRTSDLDQNTYDTEVVTRQWVRNYMIPVEVIEATSGTITLESNKIYKINLNGNTTFSLVEPTDKTKYNQIKVMLQITGTPTIVWGTDYFYQADAPDMSESGNYSIYFDYDLNMNRWICGSLFIDAINS